MRNEGSSYTKPNRHGVCNLTRGFQYTSTCIPHRHHQQKYLYAYTHTSYHRETYSSTHNHITTRHRHHNRHPLISIPILSRHKGIHSVLSALSPHDIPITISNTYRQYLSSGLFAQSLYSVPISISIPYHQYVPSGLSVQSPHGVSISYPPTFSIS